MSVAKWKLAAANKNEKNCAVLVKCKSNVGHQEGPERGKVQYMPKDI